MNLIIIKIIFGILNKGEKMMVRMTVAGIGGFLLVFIEAYMVLILKGYQTIEFGGMSPFISIWTMNFFLLFSIFTQFKPWFEERMAVKEESSIK
jgi:hypothetical protein